MDTTKIQPLKGESLSFKKNFFDLCFIGTIGFYEYVDLNNLWGKGIKLDRLEDTEARKSACRETLKICDGISTAVSDIIQKFSIGEHLDSFYNLKNDASSLLGRRRT